MLTILDMAVSKIQYWMISETHCDIVPASTPPHLNPTVIQQKLLADLQAKASNDTTTTTTTQAKAPRSTTSTRTNAKSKDTESAPKDETASEQPSTKRRRQARATTPREPLPAKQLGSFVADPSKPHPTPATIFSNIGLSKRYCFPFHFVGQECPNTNCEGDHTPLFRIQRDDRDKILNNLVTTRACFLNPALKKNSRLMGVLSDQQKTLFASSGNDSPEPAAGASE